VLENVLVEKEQLASAVYYSVDMRPRTLIQFSLSSVATEALTHAESRFFEILRQTAEKELDMKYIQDCISRERRQVKFYTEKSGNAFTDTIIKDFLFGERDGSTLRHLKSLEEYDELTTWTDLQWRELLRKWMSDADHVTILGKPSASLSKRIESEEKDRVAAQIKSLGEGGLKEKERRLAEAKAENNREIPQELLERFKVPETKSIHFIKTITARSGAARMMGRLENPIQKIIDQEKSELPLFIHFEHLPTNFVHLKLILGTEAVPVSLRPLLCIYLENFFSSPVLRDGKRVEFEQIIMDLEKDTVGYGITSASNLGNPEALVIHLEVEAEKYETAISWVKSLLFDAIFDLTVTLEL
jgi:Zn-dependent M16 (insulinase) family peptidase